MVSYWGRAALPGHKERERTKWYWAGKRPKRGAGWGLCHVALLKIPLGVSSPTGFNKTSGLVWHWRLNFGSRKYPISGVYNLPAWFDSCTRWFHEHHYTQSLSTRTGVATEYLHRNQSDTFQKTDTDGFKYLRNYNIQVTVFVMIVEKIQTGVYGNIYKILLEKGGMPGE